MLQEIYYSSVRIYPLEIGLFDPIEVKKLLKTKREGLKEVQWTECKG